MILGKRNKCSGKQLQHLKGVNPRQWWSEVNKLSGSKRQNSSLFSFLNVPEYNNLSPTEVANSINHTLLEPLQPYEPIESERVALQLPLEENPEFLEVSGMALGCRDGAVVRALASHQCGPGSIRRLGVICGLSLLVLYSAPRGFLRVLRFPLS